MYKKNIYKILVVLLVINLIISSILFWWLLKYSGGYILKINHYNKKEVIDLLDESSVNVENKEKLAKIRTKQGKGEVDIFLYYDDNEKIDTMILGSRDNIIEYIKSEGKEIGIYQEKIFIISILASIFIVILIIVLEIVNKLRANRIINKIKLAIINNRINKERNMKKLFNKTKKSIFFYTITIIIIFIASLPVLNLLNIQYRQWVYYFMILLSITGLFVSSIQIALKNNKIVKIIIGICIILTIIILISFWKLFFLVFAFTYTPEHIIEKDGKKYVIDVEAFLHVDAYYYDYINFFLKGSKIKIHEYYGKGGYDPFEGESGNRVPIEYTYYDNKGNVIKTNKNDYNKKNDNNINNDNENSNTTEETEKKYKSEKILYEKVIDSTTSIRVIYVTSILGQRSLVEIEKTNDGGTTWKKQLENGEGCITINNEAQFVFLDENIGFINNLEPFWTDSNTIPLLVTNNGGKSFVTSKIICPISIETKLFISETPYMENGILKFKAYTTNDDNISKDGYYEFYSDDNGQNWKYISK